MCNNLFLILVFVSSNIFVCPDMVVQGFFGFQLFSAAGTLVDERARKMDILNVVQSVAFLRHTFSTQSTAEHDWQAGQLLFGNISFKCKVPVFLPFIGSCKRKTEIRWKKNIKWGGGIKL